jgi:hypothetical protein
MPIVVGGPLWSVLASSHHGDGPGVPGDGEQGVDPAAGDGVCVGHRSHVDERKVQLPRARKVHRPSASGAECLTSGAECQQAEAHASACTSPLAVRSYQGHRPFTFLRNSLCHPMAQTEWKTKLNGRCSSVADTVTITFGGASSMSRPARYTKHTIAGASMVSALAASWAGVMGGTGGGLTSLWSSVDGGAGEEVSGPEPGRESPRKIRTEHPLRHVVTYL